jgi:hypothetical protein
MNFDVGDAAFLVDYLKWFHVRIKLLPLTGPVGPNFFFPDNTPAFRCLGPANVLTHERQSTVDIPTIEGRVMGSCLFPSVVSVKQHLSKIQSMKT